MTCLNTKINLQANRNQGQRNDQCSEPFQGHNKNTQAFCRGDHKADNECHKWRKTDYLSEQDCHGREAAITIFTLTGVNGDDDAADGGKNDEASQLVLEHGGRNAGLAKKSAHHGDAEKCRIAEDAE